MVSNIKSKTDTKTRIIIPMLSKIVAQTNFRDMSKNIYTVENGTIFERTKTFGEPNFVTHESRS
jgi:hypothetical protein